MCVVCTLSPLMYIQILYRSGKYKSMKGGTTISVSMQRLISRSALLHKLKLSLTITPNLYEISKVTGKRHSSWLISTNKIAPAPSLIVFLQARKNSKKSTEKEKRTFTVANERKLQETETTGWKKKQREVCGCCFL